MGRETAEKTYRNSTTYWNATPTYSRRGLVDVPGVQSWELFVTGARGGTVLCFDGVTRRLLWRFGARELTGGVGLAFGADGNLYVTSANQVVRFDGRTGVFLGVFASGGGLSGSLGIAFGPDGNLYVTSYNTDQVLRYNGGTGKFMDVFASDSRHGLVRPHGIAFGPDGNLYVTSATNKVLCFDGKTGSFLKVAASAHVVSPKDLRFGPDGRPLRCQRCYRLCKRCRRGARSYCALQPVNRRMEREFRLGQQTQALLRSGFRA